MARPVEAADTVMWATRSRHHHVNSDAVPSCITPGARQRHLTRTRRASKARDRSLAAISTALVLVGLSVVLDLGGLRTRTVNSRLEQEKDLPRLLQTGGDDPSGSLHRWFSVAGVGFIIIGLVIAFAGHGGG